MGLMPVLHALLGSIRVLVMLVSGPVFSDPALGSRIRVMAALLITWAAGPVGTGALSSSGDWDVASIVAAVGVEVMIGLSVGVGTSLVFAGILQLGDFIAIQGGLAAARAIDPASGTPSVAIGTALNTFAMLVFLVIGGHHEMIEGIAVSFETIPVGGALPEVGVFHEVARLGSVIFEVAFRFAAPVTVAIFVQNVVTGVLGRAMPQLNLLIVNLPLHAGMLFLIIGLGASDMLHVFKDVLEAWPSQVFSLVIGER